jgi:hypothetical protein
VADAVPADPFGVAERGLVDRQRRQRQPGASDDRQPGLCLAAPPPEQPGALQGDGEDREVVGGERQRRGDSPADHVSTPTLPQGADEVEGGERGEQGEQRVAARLLRVPEQHRVDRDQSRREEAGAAIPQLGAEQVGDRNRGDARGRRERAQADIAGACELRPQPGQRVVEGRRRLAEADRFHRVPEVRAQHSAGGDDLVVVVGLRAERREAQCRGQAGQPGDDPEGPRAGSHRRADRLEVRGEVAPAQGPGRLHG